MKKYNVFGNLKGDLFGGLTAGIVALPLALAFGIQAFGGINAPNAASIGALAGLVGATMLGMFAAIFGGTPSQISGPTGPMTVVAAALVSAAWSSSQCSLPAVLISMTMAALFCGLFQVLFGLIKLGKYVRYIPYPVLSGFMSGIGVIIILQQIYPLVGEKGSGSMIELLAGFPSEVADGISLTALLLGLGTILIVVLMPLLTKKVPATLVALQRCGSRLAAAGCDAWPGRCGEICAAVGAGRHTESGHHTGTDPCGPRLDRHAADLGGGGQHNQDQAQLEPRADRARHRQRCCGLVLRTARCGRDDAHGGECAFRRTYTAQRCGSRLAASAVWFTPCCCWL